MDTANKIIRSIQHLKGYAAPSQIRQPRLVIYLGAAEFRELSNYANVSEPRVGRDEFAGYPVVEVGKESYLSVHLDESPYNARH